MANDILKQLDIASFKGFPFFAEGESITQIGRKISVHDYPNSDKRFAQDLGELPQTYEVTALINSQIDNDGNKIDFLKRSEDFKTILRSEGAGELVLPHLGTLNVVALPYTVVYNYNSIGIVRFKLKFTVSNTDEVPAPSIPSVQDIFQLVSEAQLFCQDKAETDYIIPKSVLNAIVAYEDFSKAILEPLRDLSADLIVVNGAVQKIVRDFQSSLVALVKDPRELFKKLVYGNIALANGLFATISNLLASQDPKTSASTPLLGVSFGFDILNNGAIRTGAGYKIWPDDTAERQARNRNRILAVETVRVNSLILGYQAAANFDYGTIDEITAVRLELEEAYSTVMLNGDPNEIFPQDLDFKLLIDSLRTSAYQVLDAKAQQVFSTGTYVIGGVQSVMNLAYKFYAESMTAPEDLQVIAENLTTLNRNLNPTLMTGEINIFEVT